MTLFLSEEESLDLEVEVECFFFFFFFVIETVKEGLLEVRNDVCMNMVLCLVLKG
jgi:hypothetical protein